MNIRIGTRGSALARAQAADAARRLESSGHQVETVIISTQGDRVADRSFTDVGAFGIFVREIEAALLDERVDVAVHSYKDLPSNSPEPLVVAAVPERLDVADVLLTRAQAFDVSAGAFPIVEGGRVGTSAARRRALVRSLRPDAAVGLLRGNVPTRIASLTEGRFDAIVLAAAGLARLERWEGRSVIPPGIHVTRLDPTVFVPAPAQGAIAMQVRRGDLHVLQAVELLNDRGTARALQAERAALAFAEGGCSLPFGAWCRVTPRGSALTLILALGLEDGTISRAVATGVDPAEVALAAWRDVSAQVHAA